MSGKNHTDSERESLIDCANSRMSAAFDRGDYGAARYYFENMRMLIADRSSRQVEKMESDRGLV